MQLISVRQGDHQDIVRQIFALRARVFADRLGWNVTVRNGEEHDQFDDLDPIYLCILDGGQVLGCARFLPCSGPTMVRDVFSALVNHPEIVTGDRMVESSRFCVDKDAMRAGVHTGEQDAATLLMTGMIQWAFEEGYGEIVTVTDIRVERLLRRVGISFVRLGPPSRVANTIAVAGRVSTDQVVTSGPVADRTILRLSQIASAA